MEIGTLPYADFGPIAKYPDRNVLSAISVKAHVYSVSRHLVFLRFTLHVHAREIPYANEGNEGF